jgi:hypothetical protein
VEQVKEKGKETITILAQPATPVIMPEIADATRHVYSQDAMEEAFRTCWMLSTDDNNLTLHGFRRFKTTHLLSLRLLEREIAEMDHVIYQAGFTLDLNPSSQDRLGLKHAKKDANLPSIRDTITPEFIAKLRDLLKQYGTCITNPPGPGK